MRYLLDTHTLLWITVDDARLSSKVKDLFLDSRNDFFLSMASIWEMAIKISIGKLSVKSNLRRFIEEHVRGNNVLLLSLQPRHIYPLETLPFHHRDPFDRLIISQGIVEKIPIVSSDSQFDHYPITRIW